MPQPASSLYSPVNLESDELKPSHGKIEKSAFTAPWWAKNRHIQTVWPRFFQRRLKVHWLKERLILPDGDFVNLAWAGDRSNIESSKGLVVVFHGLEGSNKSHYANDMTANLVEQGYVVVLMHFRGCGGEHNTLPRAYHSGETQDAWYLLNWLTELYPNVAKVAMGFSLGANMLLKLLGERPQQTILRAGIAISPPFKLAECSLSINQGMSRMYQSYLLKSMVNNLVDKMRTVDYSDHLEIDDVKARTIKSFKEFDQHVTAPLHGFDSADDYYEKCSAVNFMQTIATPTLIIHAKDDPFMSETVLPIEQDLSPSVRLELSDKGGHVGFMQGTPWRPVIWMQKRVNQYFQEILRG
jgi:predicted alpha/beta-fold hydrolase